jgi:hypothetical protein
MVKDTHILREPAIHWMKGLPKGTKFSHSELCAYLERNFPKEWILWGNKAEKEAWYAMWTARDKLKLIRKTGVPSQRQRC